ncbi:BTAD domain-containing putative transcriptional regulator [Nonomuraea sp. NPDC050786]|uniref:AfsR/SARP family transcriptional regulator n=1 Tax=Nonomuraea sp. NPDC050786 TaxID=3154840 RepID=UPI00340EDA81
MVRGVRSADGAYAGLADEEVVRATARQPAGRRLAIVEEQAEARLATGDRLLIGELADPVARHPLRERLPSVQLRALYLAGRQSEAPASYEELRHQPTARGSAAEERERQARCPPQTS